MTRTISQPITNWCRSEVQRQGDPEEFVQGMIDAWVYAIIRIVDEYRRFTEEDIHILGGLVKLMNRAKYRETPVSFPDMSLGLDWQQINRQMRLLIEHQDDMDADEFAKRFLDIHPFEDGNGRVAAILWNLKNGTILHPVIMPDFYSTENSSG